MSAINNPVIYQSQGILVLMSRAWNLLRINLKRVLLIMAPPTLLNTLFHVLLSLFSSQAFLTTANPTGLGLSLLGLAGTCLLLIPTMIAWLVSYCLLARFYYLSLLRNEAPSLSECFQHLGNNWLRLTGMTVLLGLVVLGLIAVNVIIFYLGLILVGFIIGALVASGTTGNAAFSKLMMAAFILVTGFAALVLLVSLAALEGFLFNFPLMSVLTTTEGYKSFWRHIGDSYQLLFKHFPRVILFSVGVLLFSWTLMGVLMGPASLWMAIEMARTGMGNHQTVPIYVQSIWNIWSSLANCLVMPFHISALTLFWYDCQVRGEGLDIRLWLKRLQPSRPENDPV